jgi:3,4-dihydroxy 2-butanone 4-phosphate synthase/GTP cyclohydrolase II
LGGFRSIVYASDLNPEEHLTLVRGDVQGRERVLVRMHSRCVYSEALGSTMCDCGQMLHASLRAIAEEGMGVLVYLHATGPLRPASHGREAPRSQHEHGIGAQILSDLGLHTIRLLTNHPRKVVALEGFGIEIVDQIPVVLDPH